MGSFDEVVGRCPKCASKVEIQTKAGPCRFNNYNLKRVPLEIAGSINGEKVQCEHCKTQLVFKLLGAETVPMSLEEFDDENDESEDLYEKSPS